MRRPAPALVVDTAILIAVVLGRGSGALRVAGRDLSLLTTERAVEEARRRMELGMKRPDLLGKLDTLLADVTVVPTGEPTPVLDEAATCLRDAVASRNGSTRDAHILALAWAADADVWTTDRDFAGAGVATWSTPNLMRALFEAT